MDKINAPWHVDSTDGTTVRDRDDALVCGEVDYPYLIAAEHARLIAAAPELLQALKRVLEDNCPLTGDPSRKELQEHWEYEKSQGNGAADAMLLAHAAVAKAEGEAS